MLWSILNLTSILSSDSCSFIQNLSCYLPLVSQFWRDEWFTRCASFAVYNFKVRGFQNLTLWTWLTRSADLTNAGFSRRHIHENPVLRRYHWWM